MGRTYGSESGGSRADSGSKSGPKTSSSLMKIKASDVRMDVLDPKYKRASVSNYFHLDMGSSL